MWLNLHRSVLEKHSAFCFSSQSFDKKWNVERWKIGQARTHVRNKIKQKQKFSALLFSRRIKRWSKKENLLERHKAEALAWCQAIIKSQILRDYGFSEGLAEKLEICVKHSFSCTQLKWKFLRQSNTKSLFYVKSNENIDCTSKSCRLNYSLTKFISFWDTHIN